MMSTVWFQRTLQHCRLLAVVYKQTADAIVVMAANIGLCSCPHFGLQKLIMQNGAETRTVVVVVGSLFMRLGLW